ncbi:aminopeptidase P family protein [Pedobacter sp. L105]|uniref:aminopeptidase P family protein n=1 Tax=Pedobacter sp. L105 TaxID=1641871 RepID=UPI00131C535B|nr:aminopeptidase P family protein [Pedobacter sp. L105]
MKYQDIENRLFVENRIKFRKLLKNNSLAIFQSNDEFPKSGDQDFPFKQNADLFYLSGIDQERTILLIYPDCPNPLYQEVLFLRQTNEHIKVWEGHKYTKLMAQEASGIQNVQWLEDFDGILNSIIQYSEHIYLNINENVTSTYSIADRNIRFIEQMRTKYPLHHYERAAPLMRQLRDCKSPEEIKLIQKACDITKDAFIRVLRFTRPEVAEYEIEAEIIHEFIRQRATGHAYPPIIASGVNANILHYSSNNQACKEGDLILMDFGAEYANYNADLSRTIPVNGRFSTRQKEVYNAVLSIMKEAKKLMLPGTSVKDYNLRVGEIVTEQLIRLGLLTTDQVKQQTPAFPLYRKYFMHGISHHLGLDVHDFANRYTPFSEGNVLTCEPGIYIPEEGFGIRLENDILLTENGNIDLMATVPIEAEEIEEIMNTKA